MEKIVQQTFLYDFYGELLTERQKQIYTEVVQNDLSLSEAGERFGISRQGVYDMVKRCDKILQGYEDKLHLLEKFLKSKEMVSCIKRESQSILLSTNDNLVIEKVTKIERISNEILEEF